MEHWSPSIFEGRYEDTFEKATSFGRGRSWNRVLALSVIRCLTFEIASFAGPRSLTNESVQCTYQGQTICQRAHNTSANISEVVSVNELVLVHVSCHESTCKTRTSTTNDSLCPHRHSQDAMMVMEPWAGDIPTDM